MLWGSSAIASLAWSDEPRGKNTLSIRVSCTPVVTKICTLPIISKKCSTPITAKR